MALELVPNDNGWFITNNLVSALYRLARYEEIRDLVEENIEAEGYANYNTWCIRFDRVY